MAADTPKGEFHLPFSWNFQDFQLAGKGKNQWSVRKLHPPKLTAKAAENGPFDPKGKANIFQPSVFKCRLTATVDQPKTPSISEAFMSHPLCGATVICQHSTYLKKQHIVDKTQLTNTKCSQARCISYLFWKQSSFPHFRRTSSK